MAGTATISSIFDLSFDVQSNTGGTETYTISTVNGNRAFRVIQVLTFNAGGTGVFSASNTNGNAIVASAATVNGGWKLMILTAGNLEVANTEGLIFTINGAAAGWGAGTKVLFRCVAENGGTVINIP